MTRTKTWSLALTAAAALAACGGGSEETVAPPLATSVTIAGTAAKGAALAGAAVSIKCAAGTGTATTASNGTYTVTITGGNLPCALKVVGTEGSVFHSVVAGTTNSGNFAANITPLTEMMVAQIGGAAPGSYLLADPLRGAVVHHRGVTDETLSRASVRQRYRSKRTFLLGLVCFRAERA